MLTIDQRKITSPGTGAPRGRQIRRPPDPRPGALARPGGPGAGGRRGPAPWPATSCQTLAL